MNKVKISKVKSWSQQVKEMYDFIMNLGEIKTSKVKSWSQQAREMCDYQIAQIEICQQTIEGAIKFFHISYRAAIIRYRAAKRFGRLLKAGKIHENSAMLD